MPVPKKRLGHSDQGHRRSKWKATIPEMNTCPNCGSPKLTHTMCGTCGFYKNRVVSEKLNASLATE